MWEIIPYIQGNVILDHMKPTIRKNIEIAFLIILITALGVLTYTLWRQYVHIDRMDAIRAAQLKISNIRHSRALTIDDTGYIAPWMTFDYINEAWRIPTPYLKTTLTITDVRYPKLSIARYSRETGQDSAVVINNVQVAVRGYLTASSTQARPN